MSWRFVCNQRAPCPMWIVEPLSAHRHGLLQYVLHIPLESLNQVPLAHSGGSLLVSPCEGRGESHGLAHTSSLAGYTQATWELLQQRVFP